MNASVAPDATPVDRASPAAFIAPGATLGVMGGGQLARMFVHAAQQMGYATAVLDDGPIIQQDVVRVTHRHGVEDLVRKGRDLEKLVLAQALRWHLENRILVYGNKTVVFD